MVTQLSPALLAIFPIFLVSATVFFETEARRLAKSESIVAVLLLGLAYIVVLMTLVFATSAALIAIVVSASSEAWEGYYSWAIWTGVIGSWVYLAASLGLVSLRTSRRVREIVQGRRDNKAREAADALQSAAATAVTELTRAHRKDAALAVVGPSLALGLAFLGGRLLPRARR